eukprot:3068227-Pleurochrysis_carterae.AAC.1
MATPSEPPSACVDMEREEEEHFSQKTRPAEKDKGSADGGKVRCRKGRWRGERAKVQRLYTPQDLQWCRRLKKVNGSLHRWQFGRRRLAGATVDVELQCMAKKDMVGKAVSGKLSYQAVHAHVTRRQDSIGTRKNGRCVRDKLGGLSNNPQQVSQGSSDTHRLLGEYEMECVSEDIESIGVLLLRAERLTSVGGSRGRSGAAISRAIRVAACSALRARDSIAVPSAGNARGGCAEPAALRWPHDLYSTGR